MHDVLAHRISMVSLHAGALEVHPDAAREYIATAAGVIRGSAHAALGELREVIRLLRDRTDQSNEPNSPATPRPQPTLDDVPQLIEQSRQAGMRLSLHLRLDHPGAVSANTGRTVYRIVQEGLTNARKHAPMSAVEVRIADDLGGLSASVLTRPPSGDAQPPNPGTTGAAAPPLAPGTGTSLIGLAERVAVANGRLEYGPRPDGGLCSERDASGAGVNDRIRVMIVDDDALVRAGLRMMLAGSECVEVVAEARDGNEVLAAVDAHRPTVVLMNLRMPKVDGLTATKLLRERPRRVSRTLNEEPCRRRLT